jgi:RimJ/RimL family protein N-acetyltransferase
LPRSAPHPHPSGNDLRTSRVVSGPGAAPGQGSRPRNTLRTLAGHPCHRAASGRPLRAFDRNTMKTTQTTPIWPEPPRNLGDERIVLRTAESTDAGSLLAYASEPGGLNGVWIPLAAGADLTRCTALIDDWLAGWRNLPSLQGPALVVVEVGSGNLIGHIGFRDRGEAIVEIVYGIAPDARGRGYATVAARLAARWLLDDGHAQAVELRIGTTHVESQRVARAAGFLPAGAIRSTAEGAGQMYEDLRYVLARR